MNNISRDCQTQTAYERFRQEAAASKPVKLDFSKPSNINIDSFKLQSIYDMDWGENARITDNTYSEMKFWGEKTTDVISGKTIRSAACCYSYMERTITIESDKIKGGIMTITGFSENALFYINMPPKNSGEECANPNDCVNPDYVFKDLKRQIKELFPENRMSGKEYAETQKAGRERYNKCAEFLAGTFGVKKSVFALDEEAYENLFGKIDDDDGESFIEKSLQKLERLTEHMKKLSDCMSNLLKGIERKSPAFGGVKEFGEEYFSLDIYSYSEITLMTEKLLAVSSEKQQTE